MSGAFAKLRTITLQKTKQNKTKTLLKSLKILSSPPQKKASPVVRNIWLKYKPTRKV